MRLLSIDPGKRSLAWASWAHGRLTGAGLVTHKRRGWVGELHQMTLQVECLAGPVDVTVCEVPRIYPQERKKRPNDLIDLAVVTGACSRLGKGGRFETVTPQGWKGQTPKTISGERSLAALDPTELAILEATGKLGNHNVLDAVGIGLHWLEAHRER